MRLFRFFSMIRLTAIALGITLLARPHGFRFARDHDHLLPGTPRSYRLAH